jgi:hypothetical protein
MNSALQPKPARFLTAAKHALSLFALACSISACDADDEDRDLSHLRQSSNHLGIWLWDFNGTGFADHAKLADRLANMGVKRIYVKVADGGYNNAQWPEVDDADLVAAYEGRGLEVWAWAYNYPGNVQAQADALYHAAAAGYDGFVSDVEIEFDGKSTELHALFSALDGARDRAISDGLSDNFKLYATTWGNPEDHGMRVDIIDQYVDAHMPQTYLEVWGPSYMAQAAFWVEAGTQEYRSLGAIKPVHHIISAEHDTITAAQLDAAIAASGGETSIWRIPGNGTSQAIWKDLEAVDWDVSFAAGPTGSVELDVPTVFGKGVATPIAGTAAGDVKKVVVTVDGYQIGQANVGNNGAWSFAYAFSNAGSQRRLIARGLDAQNHKVTEVAQNIDVIDGPAPQISAIAPASATVGVPAQFSGTVGQGITQVRLDVEGYVVYTGPVNAGAFAFAYSFSLAGQRSMLIQGLDANGKLLAQQHETIDVQPGDSPELTLQGSAQALTGDPVVFGGTASQQITRVRVSVDGWKIGETNVQEGAWSLAYAFNSAGDNRAVLAEGLDAQNQVVTSAQSQITVGQGGVASVSVQHPGSVETGKSVQFSGDVSQGIVRVELSVDGWKIADVPVAQGHYTTNYVFSSAGNNRQVQAKGFSANNELLASDASAINVTAPNVAVPQLPYFYQYANVTNPGGSCQNTSMAMVLRHYGAPNSETPDEISHYYGTSQAQTVAGFQQVFNSEAAYLGLTVRDAGTTSATIADVRAELGKGNPVVVHGYFTDYGHVIVLLGYKNGQYTVHDPAGSWSQQYGVGGYAGDGPTAGRFAVYSAAAVEAAIAPDNLVWMHRFYHI